VDCNTLHTSTEHMYRHVLWIVTHCTHRLNTSPQTVKLF